MDGHGLTRDSTRFHFGREICSSVLCELCRAVVAAFVWGWLIQFRDQEFIVIKSNREFNYPALCWRVKRVLLSAKPPDTMLRGRIIVSGS